MNLNFLKKFNLGKKIIISIIIFLLLIVLVTYFTVIPTITDIKTIKDQIEYQRVDLETKYRKGQNIRQLVENLKKIEPELASLNQVFINQNREIEFITTLEKTADDNNVRQTISLGSVQEAKDNIYKRMPLYLTSQGNFLNQMNYLVSLEALNYYININSLELSTDSKRIIGGEQVPGSINLIITADTYWQ